MDASGTVLPGLSRLAPRLAPGGTRACALVRLSGGASQETWAFDIETPSGPTRLILRRAPGGEFERDIGAGLATEALVVQAAGAAGLPVAPVRHILAPADGLGRGFVSDHVEGETVARKLLRDAAYAGARARLAADLGGVLARIHRMAQSALPLLARRGPVETLAYLRRELEACDPPSPIMEFAFRWLSSRVPSDRAPVLVHGDFRNGNLIVGTEGLRAVIDWELTHLGDPLEDIGWFCAMPWRFGATEAAAGGFGSREAFYAGYAEAAGAPVDVERAYWWEVLASLRWGVNCCSYVALFEGGQDRSVERAMIARRASENEIDLLRLIDFGP